MSSSQYFSELIPELTQRSALGAISRLAVNNRPLRQHLAEQLGAAAGSGQGLVADPVFEATFGWSQAPPTIGDLSGALLSPDLVRALGNPPTERIGEDYSFPGTRHPYAHQLAAWQQLSKPAPQSVIVTSGTGSGKTECFLLPILDDLVRQAQSAESLVGVQALFLYPLNALINSQKDRLRAWTDPFKGAVRFCLYNGLTPETTSAAVQREWASEVRDRLTLRKAPPPILVTNATMLEYMLVRSQDAPIIEKSRGKLRWIVLDEAHTYMGSQAAEVALLLRRVMVAFGVTPEQIKFVATSATIGSGDEDSRDQLRSFVSSLSGVSADRVTVIGGRREVPNIPMPREGGASPTLQALREILDGEGPEALFSALLGSHAAVAVRALLIGREKSAARTSEIARTLARSLGTPVTQREALEWIDLFSAAVRRRADGEREPFLPLRVHVFHRTLPGAWACVRPDCEAKAGSPLRDPAWAFGAVYLEERARCECGAPVFPVLKCDECGAVVLSASYAVTESGVARIAPGVAALDDEFQLEIDVVEDEEEQREAAEAPVVGGWHESVIRPQRAEGSGDACFVQLDTLEIVDGPGNGRAELRLKVTTDDDPLACEGCGTLHGAGRSTLRPMILGAPFFLGQVLPTTLEFAPDGPRPLESPFRGRRALAFTDSRQGSARIAAKVQQDSERNSVRSRIVARLYEGSRRDPVREAALEEAIRRLEAADQAQPGLLSDLIAEKKRDLLALSQPAIVTYEGVHSALLASREVERWMLDYYSARDPAFKGQAGVLARMCLVREFARRPRRVNNLETMGLAQVVYPEIAAVDRGISVSGGYSIERDDWRAFLKICLDFFVRENTIINLSDQDRRWGGNLIAQKRMLPPESQEQVSSRTKRWPRELGGASHSRLSRLLAAGLGLDLSKPIDRDVVDEFLRAAWGTIQGRGILRTDGPAYYLPLEAMSFRLIDRAWICPVTRRLLDTTFKGLTPYLPKLLPRRESAECVEVNLPFCGLLNADWSSEREKVAAIRRWLAAEPVIKELRGQGLWSDLNDRVLEGAGYFRTAEHSAQQPTERLLQYEQQFKQHRLNLLSCSTTMEMGVDIGGVSAVAMNNVPPHPANYLQRAGRAGRRGETRAVAVTLCKHNPHDYSVFANPTWPFETSVTVPAVSLSSARIVQRHVNSLFLGLFLRDKAQQQQVDAIKLTSGWFHGMDGGPAPSDEYSAWCEALDPVANDMIGRALTVLLVGTPFAGTADLRRVISTSAETIRAIAHQWRQHLLNIDREIGAFATREARAEPAFKALQRTRKRHTEEYLLKDLAEEGFLPAYGFPSSLVQFDNFTVGQFKLLQSEERSREDNLVLRGDFATRDLNTALREYAPGSDVVIDGIVYRSAGVTLNWHAPASVAEVHEEQYFGIAWRCRACGAVGVAGSHEREFTCSECGADDSSLRKQVFLQPAGFAVDFYEETHTDVTRQLYVPPEEPWIQAGGSWSWLANPLLGRFRSSDSGLVYVQNSGLWGEGYAICLACGRAEPMAKGPNGPVIPNSMYGHRRLRGRNAAQERVCPGGDRANSGLLKPGVHLGSETSTDVMEIQLADESGRYVSDASTAYTVAVAVREAAAEMMGIEPEELGCDCKAHKTPAGGAGQVIVLYDQNAAGYTSSLTDRLPELLRRAVQKLKCVKDCERACQHCLMSYDTRHRSQELDRKRALAVLTDNWLAKLSLPQERWFLGPGSQPEHRVLEIAVALELQKPGSQGVRLFLQGNPDDWDIAASPIRAFAHRWAAANRLVTLVVPAACIDSLSDDHRKVLVGLMAAPNVSVAAVASMGTAGSGSLLAEVWGPNQTTAWAAAGRDIGVPAARWGKADADQLVRGTRTGGRDQDLTPVTIDQLAPRAPIPPRHEIRIGQDLNGQINGFGARFWYHLEQKDPDGIRGLIAGTQPLVKVEYTDRYVRNPLTIGLLVSVISALKSRLGARWAVNDAAVLTSNVDLARAGYPGVRVSDDWPETSMRDAVLKAALQPLATRVVVNSRDGRQVPHARLLTLHFDGTPGAKVSIWLDQGLGYWRIRQPSRYSSMPGIDLSFPHRAPVDVQARKVASLSQSVIGQDYKTVLFVTGG